MAKGVIHRIDIPYYDEPKAKYNDKEMTISKIAWQVVASYEKDVTDFTIKQLYEYAKKKGWKTVIAIDETQFERFIKECLPKWQEEQRNDK